MERILDKGIKIKEGVSRWNGKTQMFSSKEIASLPQQIKPITVIKLTRTNARNIEHGIQNMR
jgi:hypothetical protein